MILPGRATLIGGSGPATPPPPRPGPPPRRFFVGGRGGSTPRPPAATLVPPAHGTAPGSSSRSDTYRNPTPRGPRRNLRPVAARKSHLSAFTSIAICPTL